MVVIRRLVRDLDMPVRIEVCPTVREPDGLAMSSRNARLSAEERERALALSRGAEAPRASSPRRASATRRRCSRRRGAPLGECSLAPEYLELVDPQTLEPLTTLEREARCCWSPRGSERRA